MVAGKVMKSAIALHHHQKSPKPPSPSTTSTTTTTTVNTRSSFFPRSSAQVQPKPPDVSELLKLIDHLRDRESTLKTQLVEQQLLRQAASIVPSLEAQLCSNKVEFDKLLFKLRQLQLDNDKLLREREVLKQGFERVVRDKDLRISELLSEIEDAKNLSSSQRFQGLIEASGKSNLIKSLSFRKITPNNNIYNNCSINNNVVKLDDEGNKSSSSVNELHGRAQILHGRAVVTPSSTSDEVSDSSSFDVRSRVPRVPKPPPKRLFSDDRRAVDGVSRQPAPPTVPIPPPPPPPPAAMKKVQVPQPPPPPVAVKGVALMTAKVKRVPEVVEFYHSLMRRDSRRDNSGGTAEVTSTSAKDLVGEIENRSAYLLAIKTDVETQGEFIRFLIKEVETAAFTDIEDVVSFVKWLDDELSYLVDERAVLKHFNWPEQKADALREAAFEYTDLKKLEYEASSFREVARQACSTSLKKMQTLLEKLEHGVYNISRLRESAANRFKSFQIPVDWMLDTGFVSQIKLASVKLAMKYMKRVSAELEAPGSGPEEEELIVQGVRFAFRVHQFAGGFDVETMRAFEELRDKARSGRVQCQNQ